VRRIAEYERNVTHVLDRVDEQHRVDAAIGTATPWASMTA